MSDLPSDAFHPLTLEEWREWLRAHHADAKAVWLVTYKKATGKPRVDYEVAVEEGLCWGWIDGQAKGLDGERSMLRFSPRKAGSGWAKSNKERLIRLEAEGRMQAPGRAVVEKAKLDGSWMKLDESEARTVPDDLKAEFARYAEAERLFEAFPPGEKRRILEWIAQAKTEPTRRKRIEETARLAQDNIRANVWTKKE